MDSYSILFNAATSKGARKKNQDVFLADGHLSSPETTEDQHYSNEEPLGKQLHVFAVCDGVGMYPDSGPAAHAALEAIKEKQKIFNETSSEISVGAVRKWAEEALTAAKDAMLNYCGENHLKGSSTIALLAMANDFYVMVNTGDSPVFSAENDNITELSFRHNLAALKKMLGMMPVKEEECVLLHHLGDNELTYEQTNGKIKDGEIFLICSDGVSGAFDESELLSSLRNNKDSVFFVSYAGSLPGADNCTSIIIKVRKAPG